MKWYILIQQSDFVTTDLLQISIFLFIYFLENLQILCYNNHILEPTCVAKILN